jgi:hypothetical protein
MTKYLSGKALAVVVVRDGVAVVVAIIFSPFLWALGPLSMLGAA